MYFYPEDVLIIILLVVVLITNIIIISLVKKNNRALSMSKEEHISVKENEEVTKQSVNESGIVLCRNCANQFDSALNVCPDCKTAR